MKQIFTFLLVMAVGLFTVNGQTTIWTDNFETGAPSSGTRTATAHTNTADGSGPSSGCSSGNYFFRTACPASGDCGGVSNTFTGLEGSAMWRSEDLEDCLGSPDQIIFSSIDISGQVGLEFRGLFACDPAANRWEGSDASDMHQDFISVEYQIDGGGFQPGITFFSDRSAHAISGDGRGLFREDTNSDGVGDGGIPLGIAFQEFSFTILGTGTTLELRFQSGGNGGGEEIGVDFFRVLEGIILPVELSVFEGELIQKETYLNWETTTESNNYGFEVQRSKDGQDWYPLGFVAGAGNSQAIQSYGFIDVEPMDGLQYYRLVQIDFDGQTNNSQTVVINNKNATGKVGELYPNPNTTGQFQLKYKTEVAEALSIKVFNSVGQLVHKQSGSVKRGESVMELNLEAIGIGFFTCMIDNGTEVLSQKLLIQK